ncbi:MAG: DsbA family oxidoreductase [Pseudonocardia sp.]|nr:DsbA family oxidoreductase [Pseudonocardia sp.]
MKIEIWSDVVCPWCAIGRARLTKALAAFAQRGEVDVRWRSFQLDPAAPHELTGDLADHLARKYAITRAEAEAMNRQLTDLAAAEGLEFRFDRTRRGNTFDAHRVLHLAADHGVQDAMKDRLFRAYFTEGCHIADHELLVRLGAEVGLDAGEVRDVLAGDRYAAAVRADQEQARAFGIGGVPFFVIDRRYGLNGAQPVEVVAAALEQAWNERRPIR